MKNNIVKICILSTSFAGVCALILIFVHSILKPPTQMNYDNQFLSEMSHSIGQLEGRRGLSLNDLDEEYFMFSERTNVYRDNSLLDSLDKLSMIEKFDSVYIPLYTDACFSYFSNPRWDNDVVDGMCKRIKQLKQLSPKQCKNNEDFQTVFQVLEDYKDAVKLLSKTWNGLEASRENRRLTDEYKAKSFLCNNIYLCDRLEVSMINQGRSHYGYLKKRVAQLEQYNEMDKNEYDNLSSAVLKELTQYEVNAYTVYGDRLDVEKLKAEAIEHYNDASDYYNRTRTYNTWWWDN